MSEIETRHRAASLAVLVTIGLTAAKMGAAAISNSVGVLSEGIHSSLDLVSAALSFFTVRVAGKPADHDHPFGHGKIETLSSLFESLLLVAAAVWISVEAVDHFRNPHPTQHGWIPIGVMILSLGVSFFAYRHNLQAARETQSSALEVNALHFLADVLASGGVLVGLILLELTGWVYLDPLIAVAVAGYILWASMHQVKGALEELADTQLPASEVEQIASIVHEHRGGLVQAHDLRTRRSGATRHIDFHLVVCGHMTVDASHQVCDELEAKILNVFPQASVHIHVEPCEKERSACQVNCSIESPLACRKPGVVS
jgi:cation diffusion facilitator family transporter